MALDAARVNALSRRLLLARLHLLCSHGFYGVLLMHMTLSLDEECSTASTDGRRMYFGPDFIEGLSDSELEFVMMHEVLHCALLHCTRRHDRDPYLFNIACDIVVNSNILFSSDMDPTSITLEQYGEMMHLAPDGQEGYKLTAEEVYEMLLDEQEGKPNGIGQAQSGSASNQGQSNQQSKKSGQKQNQNTPGGNKPSPGDGSKKKSKDVGGDKSSQSQGNQTSDGGAEDGSCDQRGAASPAEGRLDDHNRWGTLDDDTLRDEWICNVKNAVASISVRGYDKSRGVIPACAERLLDDLADAKVDWRTVLDLFIQQEICDYSFSPPDRRFDDSPFYLPDFNDTTESVRNILFMIDTSGSMSDDMVLEAYSEIKGAIDQFGGRLQGWLGFFDGVVVPPKPFEDEEQFRMIRPYGGGGTCFDIIFDHVRDEMDESPAAIVILTDGYAPFPDESDAMGIPVLWMINNDDVTPPWGKVTRIREE